MPGDQGFDAAVVGVRVGVGVRVAVGDVFAGVAVILSGER
jgi:hypothetical protein